MASGCGSSKQKLVAWCEVAPPAEAPNLLILTMNGLVPTLQLGRDILGFGAAHRMIFVACLWMKPCGQRWLEKQQADDLCPHLKSVPGRPKYSTARPAVQLLAENSPKSHPQCYLAWHRQDIMAQMKPHSQTHAVSVKDLKKFAQSQALLNVLCQNWQHNQVPILLSQLILQPGGTHTNLSWWTQACFVPCQGRQLLLEGFGLSSSPGLHKKAAGWDVILPIV